jgi:hypothetical protein
MILRKVHDVVNWLGAWLIRHSPQAAWCCQSVTADKPSMILRKLHDVADWQARGEASFTGGCIMLPIGNNNIRRNIFLFSDKKCNLSSLANC